MSPRVILLTTAALLRLLADRCQGEVPGDDLFEKKIRPLLEERCLECHSTARKVKGGLTLDSRAGWAKGGDSGPAVEPGKVEESLLIKAVRYQDQDLKMPPKKRLAPSEVTLLEEWVKAGAPDPRVESAVAKKKQTGLTLEEGRKFWAYQPPREPVLPSVRDSAWARQPLDRFILARLESAHLRPAPDATPAVLARRIYFGLIGLPPTPEQVAHFEKEGIEKAVDALLASPQFGEAWGRHWLDVARFAESSGGGRTLLFKDAWRYRDYVIEAFNRDLPFDRFIQEQIAGDLLPAENSEQRRRQLTATAFLALGPTNYEEQDKQQLRFDVIDEQLDTLGRGILGQTIGCARCHDHKFDPIPQRDYYALAGILASTRTLLNYTDNVARWIDQPLPLEGAEEAAVAAQEARVAGIKTALEAAKRELAELKKRQSSAALAEQDGKAAAVDSFPGIVIDDAEAKAIGEWKESQYTAHYIGAGYRHDMNSDKGLKTLTFTPKIPVTGRYEVRLAYPAYPNRAKHVPVHVFHADGEETVYVDQTLEPSIDSYFISLGQFRFEKDGAGYVLVSNEGTTGYVGADAVQFLNEEESAARTADGAGGEVKPDALKALQGRVKDLEASLKKALADGPGRPVAMAVREDEQVANVKICIRGQVHQRGEEVPRGFLRVALESAPLLPERQSGRRELAAWLASPQNPLTARVWVNRTWHWLFGAGLVRTTDNFGTTGEPPSHPELLDYLALRFIEQGWSIKKLVREIVLSHTWQLAGARGASPGSETDPDNRLWAHAARRRLDAEQLRDAILTVSGELRPEVGGPNIAGAGEINANNTSAQEIEYKYEYKDARRSVYTPAFRNKRLELFEAFDFGDINATQGRRNVSTVAPQALFLLNHPFILAQSRLAAARALASSSSDEERLEAAFRTALARPPNARELDKCRRLLAGIAPGEASRLEAWAEIYQSLFGCVDFRYLE